MGKHFVKVRCNICVDWTRHPPVYRGYVNDELFTERTYDWSTDFYLIETLQLQVDPGKYAIKFHLVDDSYATLKVENMHVVEGPASIKSGWLLRVGDNAST